MKRTVCGILALALALSLAGCVFFTDPNEEPEVTSTEQAVFLTPSPEPTEAPVTGIKDFFTVIEVGSSIDLDIDFNGKDETISVFEDAEEHEDVLLTMVKVSSRSGSAEALGFVSEETQVIVVDFDETDSTLDLLACGQNSVGDMFTYCMRKVEGESGYSNLFGKFGFSLPADYEFHSEDGLPVFTNTDLLGTYKLTGSCTIVEGDFVPVGGMLYYPDIEDPENAPQLLLEKDLDLMLVYPGSGIPMGENLTIPAGETVYPYSTDLDSFVIVRLADGRYGMAELSIETDAENTYYFINGVNQDEYGQIPYAG